MTRKEFLIEACNSASNYAAGYFHMHKFELASQFYHAAMQFRLELINPVESENYFSSCSMGRPSSWTRRATFAPKKLSDLRPEMFALIGVTVSWRYAGTGGDDEPYPGQHRWDTNDERFEGHWVPDEDLKP